jgi:hypothetical protein
VCCESRDLKTFPKSTHLVTHGTEICCHCVGKYLKNKINENITDLTCPSVNCRVSLNYHEIKEHITKDIFAKYVLVAETDNRYDQLLCQRAYEADPSFRWCTNRNCSAGQLVENGGNSSS